MATLKDSSKINFRAVLFIFGVSLVIFNPYALAHTDVTAEQAQELIESTNDLIVVDVREPFEYCDTVGHIPGALNYPLSSGVLEARYEELPIDGPVLVVCRSGGRSNVAANFLDSMGFSMVYDMMGGMSAWIWETSPCKDDGGSGTTDSAETNIYLFLPGQSTVVQTGGIAGVHLAYSVEGLFQLTFDPNAGTASFAHVDANATDDSPLQRTLDPNEVFGMASLVGAVLDDRTISFTGKADDGSDVLITVTIEDDLAYLVGETIPPPNSADFFLFSLDSVAQRKYGGGTGEPNEPYRIATTEDLVLLGDSSEDYDKYFILTADIDLDPNLPGRKVFDKAVIAPDLDPNDLDFQGTSFTGVFDGNGHVISHITIEGESYLGLFGRLDSGATVKNLGLDTVYVKGTSDFIGGLVGSNDGSITTCYSAGMVTGDESVGGLVGQNTGHVIDSYSMCITHGNYSIGGFIGENGDSVQYGFIGGTVKACYSTGEIKGIWNVGGLVGRNPGDVKQSCSTSFVNGVEAIGGLVGRGSGTIDNCYCSGNVNGEKQVGGLVGKTWDSVPPQGGFGITYFGTISCCYSTSLVTGVEYVGGLVGNIWNFVYTETTCLEFAANSFWDTEVSGQTKMCGTGNDEASNRYSKNTTEMQTASTFIEAGWDFVDETENGTEDIWWIIEGEDYPRLWWETSSSD